MIGLRRWLLASISGVAFAVSSAGPAAADPASMIITALGGAAAIGTAGVIAVHLGVGLALSYVSRAISNRRAGQGSNPGLQTQVTTEGGSLPQTRILGRYATAGNVVAPFWAYGTVSGVDQGVRIAVYDVADAKTNGLRAVWVDGKRFSTDTNLKGGTISSSNGAYPLAADEPAWVKTFDGVDYPALRVRFYDGTQTTADSLLITQTTGSKRPWLSDMTLKGVSFAIMRYRYDPDLFTGEPRVRFELDGESLYDRRSDTTDGGSGAQRAGDRSTWSYSGAQNPIVQVENLLRGLPLDEGGVWGLGVETEDLPRGPWVEAMNYCDVAASYGPRFRAGYEIRMSGSDAGGDDPLDVVDELLKACTGAIADCGGTWIPRAGPPGAAVASITDDDILLDTPQEFRPFEQATQVFNACRASHPHPSRQWEASESPIFVDSAALTADGNKLNVAELDLPAVPYRPQVKALQAAYVRDSRRQRRHTITLPAWFSNLMPLDAFTWTSARNGYTAKRFEIDQVTHDPNNLCVTLSVRERDPADYDWTTDDLSDDPGPTIGDERPQYYVLPAFDAEAAALEDGTGTAKVPAIRIRWAKRNNSRMIEWQGRRAGTTDVKYRGQTWDVDDGEHYIRGLPTTTNIEVRARGRFPRTEWSAWDLVTTQDIKIAIGELSGIVVYDRTLARFRRGPKAQNLSTSGWRSSSTSTWTRIGTMQLRRTAGAISQFDMSFRVAAWGDDAQAEIRLLRRLANGTWRQVDSAKGRAGDRGTFVDYHRLLVDENKGGADPGALGTQTTYALEVRRTTHGGGGVDVRVNDIRVSASNFRKQ